MGQKVQADTQKEREPPADSPLAQADDYQA